MNGAGVDTYIDAVQSKGKFAVVAEKVKETAAAAGKDVVVRVESKVEKLEEKLKVVTEKDPSSYLKFDLEFDVEFNLNRSSRGCARGDERGCQGGARGEARRRRDRV